MLTVISIPKPFSGTVGQAQERAVASWCRLDPGVQVVLVGDETAASVTGADHVRKIARNGHGTPLLDDAFRQVEAIARHRLRCFVNTDVVLLPDVVAAVRRVVSDHPRFLLVGQTRDLTLAEEELASHEVLRRRAQVEGTLRGPAAIDWFVFPAGLFDPMPAFAVGRAAFDNWMIWKARQLGPVIDATEAVLAIHQPHDYSHLEGGKSEAYYGEEAARNAALAGGRRHIYTLHDASHKMRADGSIVRNFGAILRTRETIRRSRAKLQLMAGSLARETR